MAGFTPVEEVERISMGPRDMVARVVRDFCREGWVGDQRISTSMVGLAEEVELSDGAAEEEEEEEDTLEGGGSGSYYYKACGGGGGSFNVGNNQQNECCYNKAGHGQVTITLL